MFFQYEEEKQQGESSADESDEDWYCDPDPDDENNQQYGGYEIFYDTHWTHLIDSYQFEQFD
jgi:hypothetical protein